MFEYVTGYVEYVGPEYVVIDHNGIGYQIFTPNPYVFQRSKQEIRVYTYHYVREDIMALYGFKTREERLLFTKLLGVSGIGPKGALAILASVKQDRSFKRLSMKMRSFSEIPRRRKENSTPNDFRFKRKTSRCRTGCIC